MGRGETHGRRVPFLCHIHAWPLLLWISPHVFPALAQSAGHACFVEHVRASACACVSACACMRERGSQHVRVRAIERDFA